MRRFQPEDLAQMKLQPMQAHLGGQQGDIEYAKALAAGGDCYTATVMGEPIACIGLIKYWEGRQYVWAFLSDDAGRAMIPLTRNIARWLRFHGFGRLETAIDATFDASVRWAEMLGFEREGLMREWTPDGRDCYLYARVRN